MASLGSASIILKPDTGGLIAALRVIAKHAEACADELELLNRKDTENG